MFEEANVLSCNGDAKRKLEPDGVAIMQELKRVKKSKPAVIYSNSLVINYLSPFIDTRTFYASSFST
jgi:hypothetical protein